MKIILKVIGLFGWQNLLKWTWEAVKPTLDDLAKKTETKLDDDMIKFLDKIISELANNGDLLE